MRFKSGAQSQNEVGVGALRWSLPLHAATSLHSCCTVLPVLYTPAAQAHCTLPHDPPPRTLMNLLKS